jgi:hypothetical protein
MAGPPGSGLTSLVTRAGHSSPNRLDAHANVRAGVRNAGIQGEAGGPGRGCPALASRLALVPICEEHGLRFDHELELDAPPYAGRHRKGWPTARGGWRRVYRPRVRIGPDPSAPGVPQRTHRGLPVAPHLRPAAPQVAEFGTAPVPKSTT